MSKPDVDNSEHVRTDEVKLYKRDNASSVIMYEGRAVHMGVTTGQNLWQISRTLTQGTEITRTFADDGRYTQVWDSRASLFPSADLTNLLSTQFDGTSDFVNFGSSALNYDTNSQFSVELWCRPDNLAATRCLWAKSTNDGLVDGVNIQHLVTSGLIQLQMRATGSDTVYTTNIGISALIWNHVVFTYSGSGNISGARIYISNVVATTPASAVITGTMLAGQNFILGARNTVFHYSGYIDEVKVWGKALTAAEVTQCYNGGTPIDPNTLSFAGDLVSWYRMGDGDAYPTILDNAGSYDGTMTNMASDAFKPVVP